MRLTSFAAIFTFLLWGTPAFAGSIPDFDADGVGDLIDNCSQAANPAQDDTDHDDCGNLCDADYCQAGIVDFCAFGLFTANFGSPICLFQHSEPICDPNRQVSFADFGFFTSPSARSPGLLGRRPEPSPARRGLACGDGPAA